MGVGARPHTHVMSSKRTHQRQASKSAKKALEDPVQALIRDTKRQLGISAGNLGFHSGETEGHGEFGFFDEAVDEIREFYENKDEHVKAILKKSIAGYIQLLINHCPHDKEFLHSELIRYRSTRPTPPPEPTSFENRRGEDFNLPPRRSAQREHGFKELEVTDGRHIHGHGFDYEIPAQYDPEHTQESFDGSEVDL